jgi:methylenetetrahydrofolate dehydrogenase (NADP+)/methenyltetrahydrofolate cyclohydrolase
VGDDGPSANYVAMKHRDADDLGMASFDEHLPADAPAEQVLEVIRRFNADPAVDAYIAQYPFPKGLDYETITLEVEPDKDADGLHAVNLGKLVMGSDGPLPCTPAGIVELLHHFDVPVEGQHVVIVGRGLTIGRPLANLLALKRPGLNAAVTVVHTGVADWAEHTRRADILVAAAGVPGMIQPEHVNPGGVVVGAGVQYAGRTLLPDVDEACEEVAGWITPRVGGVGPTTIALLFRNFVEAAERHAGTP